MSWLKQIKFAGLTAAVLGAGVLGFLGFIFLLVTAAYGLIQAGLAPWLGFLIVAVVLLIIAAILGVPIGTVYSRVHGARKALAAALRSELDADTLRLLVSP